LIFSCRQKAISSPARSFTSAAFEAEVALTAMENLSTSWLLQRIVSHGQKPFLHRDERTWSYVELSEAAALQSQRLVERGVRPGEIVALVADYSFEAIALLVALIAHRNIIVPISTAVPAEIEHRIAIGAVHHVVRVGESTRWEKLEATSVPPLLQKLASAGRSGLVLFSSGSAGQPKAMVHDLDRLLDSYRERRPRTLTLLVFLMFDHIGGLNTLFTALAGGAAMVITRSREPDEVCALIARHEVAVLPASPTFLNLVLMSEAYQRHNLRTLRVVTYGTEPMPENLLHRLRGALPKVKFIQTFGTSETGISQTTSKSSDSTLLKLDDPNVEHRIVDGELWLRSRTQILGYLNHSMQSFTGDGWFKTGDLVEAAEDGYLRITGRRSEVINVGGEKVLPAEVEAVLMMMPEVADCVVRGAPNPITGQVVTAEIVLAPTADPAAIRKQVRQFCLVRLAAYKVPVKVSLVPQTRWGERFKKIRVGAPVA
jgi:acyl-coenzyme A synthetase/AMP-(fatty) acid ligase